MKVKKGKCNQRTKVKIETNVKREMLQSELNV